MLAIVIALTTLLRAQPPVRAFLWRVTRPDGARVSLAGSIHLLRAEDYPLAPAYDAAFREAGQLIEEVDLGAAVASDAQFLLLQRGMLPPGERADARLSAPTNTALAAAAARLALPLTPLLQFKPWSLAMTLESIGAQQAGFDPALGLDQHFYTRAVAAGVPVRGLETLAFQIDQLDSLPADAQDRMLSSTLRQLGDETSALPTLAAAWHAGDAAAVERLALTDLRGEPVLYDRLLRARNRRWLPVLDAAASRLSPPLVVVGAAHLVGPDGLIALLQQRGYTAVQAAPETASSARAAAGAAAPTAVDAADHVRPAVR